MLLRIVSLCAVFAFSSLTYAANFEFTSEEDLVKTWDLGKVDGDANVKVVGDCDDAKIRIVATAVTGTVNVTFKCSCGDFTFDLELSKDTKQCVVDFEGNDIEDAKINIHSKRRSDEASVDVKYKEKDDAKIKVHYTDKAVDL